MTDQNIDPKNHTFVELFAGTGLFGKAFIQEGFVPIQAVEFCAQAAATYRSNVGDHIKIGDVKTLSARGKADLLIGGPPCQGFSTLGKRDSSDPRNKLGLEMVRWAKESDAKVVVVENVGAFLGSTHYQVMRRKFEKLGYVVSSFILDAADHKVPQHRVRSFTIASKIGSPEIPHSHRPYITVREAFKNLPRIDGKDTLHKSRPISDLASARMSVLPANGGKKDIMLLAPELVPESWWKIPNQAVDVWRRMDWNKPSNTIRTSFINPSKGRYVHPVRNRVITLREAARLHSIPDDWKFHGTDTSVARQIGNSVPPLLGRAVARSVKNLFRDSNLG